MPVHAPASRHGARGAHRGVSIAHIAARSSAPSSSKTLAAPHSPSAIPLVATGNSTSRPHLLGKTLAHRLDQLFIGNIPRQFTSFYSSSGVQEFLAAALPS